MSLTEGIHTLTPTSPHLDAILSGIIHVHAECIINDHTMATFLPPLSYPKMLTRWTSQLEQVSTGQRAIIVHLSKISDRVGTVANTTSLFAADPDNEQPVRPVLPGDLEVAGLIGVYMPLTETGSMRGEVVSFVVSGYHRARGVGRKLMSAIEAEAFRHGKWNLMLDTTVGTPAEKIYPKLGWTRVGVVRDYGYVPTGEGDGVVLRDEVWFCKDLRRMRLGEGEQRTVGGGFVDE